jgi:RNA polymerase sigma-70 factor (ECF subfamily)
LDDAAAQLYDRLLICRCQSGDEGALAELIARYSPGLRFYLRKLAGDAEAADDLLQDTWWDVYRKLDTLQNPAAFAAWVYRIARDKGYRELRRRPRATLETDAQCPEVAAPDGAHFSTEDVERVRRALDDLPPEHREVIVLWFVEGMTYERIAVVIDRPVGTVRSRIHHAKLKLRLALDTPAHPKRTPDERERTRPDVARR